MMRAIQASTTDLTAGSSSLTSGVIYLVYEEVEKRGPQPQGQCPPLGLPLVGRTKGSGARDRRRRL